MLVINGQAFNTTGLEVWILALGKEHLEDRLKKVGVEVQGYVN